ncbi:MAG: PIN domain-containing protein [Candidatus Diapherotrites archaeon]|uniref:PIN domain-containing protein n=1 Tax=Candidatus Iainarchaeum sp. TaxID=3101447 RepID=A0A7K4BYU8_9ARCH|nr:PIN domain-containing protein [Candidatus Diapherotrites archaeon]
MKVTVDANILIAALIKGGSTRKILTNSAITVFAPAFLFSEIIKYKREIVKKSKGSEDDFNYLFAILLKNIKIIDDKELLPYLPAAKTLISDKKDLLYFACALYKDTVIWSNDKEFKKQKRVKIFTTEEMLKEVGAYNNS